MALSPTQMKSMFTTNSLAKEGGGVPLASTTSRMRRWGFLALVLLGAVGLLYAVIAGIPRLLQRQMFGSPAVAAVPAASGAKIAPATTQSVKPVFNAPVQVPIGVDWVLGDKAGVSIAGVAQIVAVGDDLSVGRVVAVGLRSVDVLGAGGLRVVPVERLARGTGNGGTGARAAQGRAAVSGRSGFGSWLANNGYSR